MVNLKLSFIELQSYVENLKKCDNRMEVKVTTNVFDNIDTMYVGIYMQVSTIAGLKIFWNLAPPSLIYLRYRKFIWGKPLPLELFAH